MSRTTMAGVITAIVAAALIGAFFWFNRSFPVPGSLPQPPQPEAVAEPPPVVASAPEEVPAIQYPIEEASAGETPLPTLDRSDKPIAAALTALIGQRAMTMFVQSDGFVRRVVATVDNLPRSHVAPRMWPVHPTTGRFAVTGADADKTIAPDNSQRYAPLLVMAESVNTQHAAAIYIRFYPLFQKAYEELGYPGRYFNDRLVAVIDHLLSTPEPKGPVHVTLTEVKGTRQQQQPWLHYEYADPELQDLSAGQKLMIRMGIVNERRVKIKLRELRVAVTNPQLKEQHGASGRGTAPATAASGAPPNTAPKQQPASGGATTGAIQ